MAEVHAAGERDALVTGANTGIGLACALRLARSGFAVTATVRSEDKARAVHDAARGVGVEVDTELLEVTDTAACARLIAHRRPSVLVNNAGINAVAAIEETSDEDLLSILAVNAVAPIRLARLAVPHMRARGGGRIVNVSSAEGRIMLPLLGGYQASKHALEAMTAALRVETARDGIRVSSVQPGNVDTAIYDKGFWVDEHFHQGSRYACAYERLKNLMRANGRTQSSPDAVAEVIVKVVTTPHPKARYLVGLDARALTATHQLVPALLRERLYRKVFAL